MSELKITISQLEDMLDRQKEAVIERLLGNSSSFNAKNDDGNTYAMDINKEAFRNLGMKANYPHDFNILKRYVK